jgi:Tfp pilus assembly protein PilP
MTLRFVLLAMVGLLGLAPAVGAQGQAAVAAAKDAAKAANPGTESKPAPRPSAQPAQPPATPAAGQVAQAAPAAPQAPATSGFSYSPEGRRDPFISLLRRGSDVAVKAGVKAPGIKGLGAGEVTLRGTMASQGGFVAIVQGADSKTYIVRPGERLADGTIRSITADALVILQQVNDPLSLEKQREVRKVLRQTEEGRQ